MIKLKLANGAEAYISARNVSSITRDEENNTAVITMSSGEVFRVESPSSSDYYCLVNKIVEEEAHVCDIERAAPKL